MNILRSLLIVIEVFCSVLLIGLILLQKSKGGGLGVAFGGGGEGSMFGSRTGNVLTKATIVLGLIFLLNTLVLGILFTRASAVGPSDIDRELMKETSQEQRRPTESAAPAVPPAEEPQSEAVPPAQLPDVPEDAVQSQASDPDEK